MLPPVAGERLPGLPEARLQVTVPVAPPESVAVRVTPAPPAVALAFLGATAIDGTGAGATVMVAESLGFPRWR